MALLGCGCGLLAGIGILCVFALLTVQYVHERHDPRWSRQDLAICEDNLQYLKQALEQYQQDHSHQLPARLDDLRGHYLDTPARLHCPLELKDRGQEYLYTPNAPHPTDPLITCRNHGQGTLVLLKNGHFRIPGIQGVITECPGYIITRKPLSPHFMRNELQYRL